MGQSDDFKEDDQKAYLSARSATEDLIAVAKNLREFGKSFYLDLQGDKIWVSINQTVYNLKSFLQLYTRGSS